MPNMKVALDKKLIYVQSPGFMIFFSEFEEVGLKSNASVILVYPGALISLTCTHHNVKDQQTRWEVKGFPPLVIHHDLLEANLDGFGPFSFSASSGPSGRVLTSTIQATATKSLNGTMVLCRDGGGSMDTVVGNLTVLVVGMLIVLYMMTCSKFDLCLWLNVLVKPVLPPIMGLIALLTSCNIYSAAPHAVSTLSVANSSIVLLILYCTCSHRWINYCMSAIFYFEWSSHLMLSILEVKSFFSLGASGGGGIGARHSGHFPIN